MKDYFEKIAEIGKEITEIAETAAQFHNQTSALASISDIDRLAYELRKLTKEAFEFPL